MPKSVSKKILKPIVLKPLPSRYYVHFAKYLIPRLNDHFEETSRLPKADLKFLQLQLLRKKRGNSHKYFFIKYSK